MRSRKSNRSSSLWPLVLHVCVAAVAITEQQHDVAMIEIGAQRLLEHLHDRAILDYNPTSHYRQLQAANETDGVVSSSSDLTDICRAVEASFRSESSVECRCMGSLHRSFSMSCEYKEEVCSNSDASVVCGKPQLAVSMVQGNVFSSTTCVKNYRRGMLPMDDTCVFVDACPHAARDGFCSCTASYGGAICRECEVCPGGRSISVDCTNINVEAVTKQCQPVDLDLDLSTGSGSLAGFAPTFSGFCSELEQVLDNRIACDCTDAVGGSFSLSCHTTEDVCRKDGRLCGKVKSTVEVTDGTIHMVTTCGTYTSEPFLGGETCTHIQPCPEGQDGVCGCWATYDGKKCNACEVSQNGSGITIDCSNVHENAIVKEYQPVNLTTSYEFLPNYPVAPKEEVVLGSSNKGTATSNSLFATGFIGLVMTLMCALLTSLS
jgi:hypothetical protein